tara:strand:+ start:318 stop:578 length:261 start_codon:yes stop_codon:yes gene_type:complete
MVISKKSPLIVTDSETGQINRSIQLIYDDLNEVINSVNLGNTSEERKSFSGKSGDIRLAKLSDKTYEIQGKTDEGWVKVAMTLKEN